VIAANTFFKILVEVTGGEIEINGVKATEDAGFGFEERTQFEDEVGVSLAEGREVCGEMGIGHEPFIYGELDGKFRGVAFGNGDGWLEREVEIGISAKAKPDFKSNRGIDAAREFSPEFEGREEQIDFDGIADPFGDIDSKDVLFENVDVPAGENRLTDIGREACDIPFEGCRIEDGPAREGQRRKNESKLAEATQTRAGRKYREFQKSILCQVQNGYEIPVLRRKWLS